MYRFLVSFIFAFVMFFHTHAEDASRFLLGMCGEFNVNIPGQWTTIHSVRDPQLGLGCSVGMRGKWEKSPKLFLETGLGLSYNNLKLYDKDYNSFDKRIDKYILFIPVNIGWKIEIDDEIYFSPMGSIETSFVLGGKMGNRSLVGKNGVWHRYNFAIGVGLGIIFNKVSIGTMGYLGIINMIKDHSSFNRRIINDNYVKIYTTYYFKAY